MLALGVLAACASVPTLAPSVAPLPPARLALSGFASDSLDILQCAQRIGASAGFFPADTTGTVLVRGAGVVPFPHAGAVPVRRPGAVPAQQIVAVRTGQSSIRGARILIRPRTRAGWSRANARTPGGTAASTREVVQLMNSRCTLRRVATP